LSQSLLIDSLINLFGLLGLVATILTLRRRGAAGPMRVRWSVALGLVVALYFFRGLYWVTEAPLFDSLTVVVALLVPTGCLVLAEGLVRRHAPLAVKLLVTGGAAAVALYLAVAADDPAVALGGYVGASLVLIGTTCAFAMHGLAPAERRAIGALALCLLLLVPAALSDFRSLFPDTPARLSPLALLILVWVGLNSGSMPRSQRIAQLTLLAAVAAAAGFGLAGASRGLDGFAASAVILTAMILLSICGRLSEAGGESGGLRRRLAAAPAGGREELMAALAEDPLIGGGVLLTPASLGDHDVPGLRELLSGHPVLRLRDAPWGQAPSDIAVESARALLEARNATHLLLIDDRPLSLLALACPSIAAGEDLEADIALVQRVIRLTPCKEHFA
jgi:hypothetical protein